MEKMKENRRKWFGYVLRKVAAEATRVVIEMNVEEARERKRPKS